MTDIYETEPKEYVNSDATERLPGYSDEEVGIAICKCPLPLNYGIIIPKEYFDENGVATYKCKKCGLIGQLCVGRRFSGNEFFNFDSPIIKKGESE